MKKAHVLNLPSRPELFQQVQRDFAPFGVECIREIGVSGVQPIPACTTSHLNFVKNAMRENWPFAVLFEDDCMPCAAMLQWKSVSEYLLSHKKEWDLFYGGATMVHPTKWICGFQNSNVSIIQCKHALAVHFVIYNDSSFAKAIQWFELPEAEEKRPAIDTWLTNIGLRIWTTSPALAVQRPSFSNSLGKIADYSEYFERSYLKLQDFIKLRRKSWTYRLFGKFLQGF